MTGSLMQRLPVTLQAGEQCRIILRSGPVARHNDNIGIAHFRAGRTKTLPNQSLESIPIGRKTYPLFRDRQAKARIPQTVRSVEHRKRIIGGAATLPKYEVKIRLRR